MGEADGMDGTPPEIHVLDQNHQPLDPARFWASVAKITLPLPYSPADVKALLDGGDGTTLLVLYTGEGSPVAQVAVLDEQGRKVEARDIPLVPVRCVGNEAKGRRCARSRTIRLESEPASRYQAFPTCKSDHCFSALLGGRLSIEVGTTRQLIPIGGPREVWAAAPRLRVQLRGRLVRETARGKVPWAASEGDALRLMAGALDDAERIWGQCGIGFGPRAERDLVVVDPPEIPHLTLGAGLGIAPPPGMIGFRAAGREVKVDQNGSYALRDLVSLLFSRATEQQVKLRVYRNPPSHQSLGPSYDLVFASGTEVTPLPAGAGDKGGGLLFTHVDLTDGLTHFSNSDSNVGSHEERVLLDHVLDRDPITVDVVVVPSFEPADRLGESFMVGEENRFANVIILSAEALAVSHRTHVLAHELGHVLMRQPGHPDVAGPDTPFHLMDADASDPSALGPRRLSAEDCRRVWSVSGPARRGGILVPWPLPE